MVLKVATRGSKLALKQTDIAIAYLKKYLKDIDFEIVIVKTHGDKDITSALYNMQTNGVFVKDIEEALVCHQADIEIQSWLFQHTQDAGTCQKKYQENNGY